MLQEFRPSSQIGYLDCSVTPNKGNMGQSHGTCSGDPTLVDQGQLAPLQVVNRLMLEIGVATESLELWALRMTDQKIIRHCNSQLQPLRMRHCLMYRNLYTH